MTSYSKKVLTERFAERRGMVVFAKDYVPITLEQFFNASQARYPDCPIGDWKGNLYDADSVKLKSTLDLIQFGDADSAVVMYLDAPPLQSSFDLGPYPHIFWNNAVDDVKRSTSHAMVLVNDPVSTPEEAIGKARALTLLTAIVSSLIPSIGILSVIGGQGFKPEFFSLWADASYKDPLMGVSIWVRVVFQENETSRDEFAFTMGLNDFGLPECLYADVRPGREAIIRHSNILSQYFLRMGRSLVDGDKIPPLEDCPAATVEKITDNNSVLGERLRINWSQ